MRIRIIEYEGDDAAALAALTGLMAEERARTGVRAVMQELPAPAAPVKAPRGRLFKPRKAKAEANEQPGEARLGSKSAAVKEALNGGPKTSREVAAYLQKHGWPEYTEEHASAALTYLRSRGRVTLGEDGLWRIA